MLAVAVGCINFRKLIITQSGLLVERATNPQFRPESAGNGNVSCRQKQWRKRKHIVMNKKLFPDFFRKKKAK
jgi:hypothetical protein